MELSEDCGKRQIKRALVLEGGGAKGAFSFGCIKALNDREIRFDAVSGTSVGALNAVICSTGKFDEGERLWTFLSYQELFSIQWPGIFAPIGRLISPISRRFASFLPSKIRHPLLIDLIFAMASFWLWKAASHMIRWFLVGHEPLHRLFRPLMSILIVAPMVLIWYFICPYDDLRILTTAVLAVGGFFFVYERQSDRRTLLAAQYVFFLVIGTLAFVAANIAALFGEPYNWPPHVGYWLLAGYLIVFGLFSASEHYIYDVGRLHERICDLLQGAKLGMPTYVTTAVEKKFFDGKVALPLHHGQTRPTEVDSYKYGFEPVYHRIDAEHGVRLSRRILASASLPGGIFPPVDLDGVMHVDGGAAGDAANTPVEPVADYDEIWVVRLRSGPYSLPPKCKARLVLIRPDFNRSFAWGTLQFDAEQVRDDILAGKEAAGVAIDTYDAGRVAASCQR